MNFEDLKTRVDQFQTLELPGQPMMMHTGTMYLVTDMWREIRRLREGLDRIARPHLSEDPRAIAQMVLDDTIPDGSAA